MKRSIRAQVRYRALPDTTPEQELSVLAAAYAYILKRHEQKELEKTPVAAGLKAPRRRDDD
jgi:hypothetical protein